MPLTFDQLKLLEYAGYGLASGVIGTMARERRLTLPRIYKVRDGTNRAETVVDPGFLAAPVLGAVLAMIVDGRPQTALAYGLAAGFVGPALLHSLLEPLLKRFGIDLELFAPGGSPQKLNTNPTHGN